MGKLFHIRKRTSSSPSASSPSPLPFSPLPPLPPSPTSSYWLCKWVFETPQIQIPNGEVPRFLHEEREQKIGDKEYCKEQVVVHILKKKKKQLGDKVNVSCGIQCWLSPVRLILYVVRNSEKQWSTQCTTFQLRLRLGHVCPHHTSGLQIQN